MAAIVPLLPEFPAVLRSWLQADLEAYRVWVAAIGMNVRQRVAERLLRRIMEAWRYVNMPELVSSSDESVGIGVETLRSSESSDDDEGVAFFLGL